MGLIMKLLAVWGVLDSLWLAARPREWSSFWGKTVGIVGENPQYARAVAGLQLAACLWMLRRK